MHRKLPARSPYTAARGSPRAAVWLPAMRRWRAFDATAVDHKQNCGETAGRQIPSSKDIKPLPVPYIDVPLPHTPTPLAPCLQLPEEIGHRYTCSIANAYLFSGIPKKIHHAPIIYTSLPGLVGITHRPPTNPHRPATDKEAALERSSTHATRSSHKPVNDSPETSYVQMPARVPGWFCTACETIRVKPRLSPYPSPQPPTSFSVLDQSLLRLQATCHAARHVAPSNKNSAAVDPAVFFTHGQNQKDIICSRG